MNRKAVVLGCNYYIGLSIIRNLGKEGIRVVGMDYKKKRTYGFSSKYCKEKYVVPHYKREKEKLVEFLVDYGKKQVHSPVLFPGADPYMEIMDEYFEVLKPLYIFPQQRKGLNRKLMDKNTLYEAAKKHKVRVPETLKPDTENLKRRVAKDIGYPCLIKPVSSGDFVAVFREKMFVADSWKELSVGLERAEEHDFEVVIQRMIPGFDDHMYTFDGYFNQEGKLTHGTTFQKWRQYPINFGASVFTIHKYEEEVFTIGKTFLEEVGYRGFAEIEFKKDEKTGRFYVIEINARTTNFNELITALGLNMPLITYGDMTGAPLEDKFIKDDTNKAFWYAYEDLLAWRDYRRKGQLTSSALIQSLFRPKVYAIWMLTDPKPWFHFQGILMGKVFRKLCRS